MRPAAFAIVLLLCATACAPKAPSDVTVFAASSLTGVFTALAKRDPSLHVTFDLGASSTLATQIAQGGPADVFASADRSNMRKASSRVLLPKVFARNRLEIVVAHGNPKHITSLADLAQPGLVVALCAQQVPCGAFADEALTKAHVTVGGVSANFSMVPAASREDNVKAVLTKVELGEADAGIVYTTDVLAAGTKVDGVTIPSAENVVTSYPIAVVKGAPHEAAARRFVRLVLSETGRRVLRRYGFLPPA